MSHWSAFKSEQKQINANSQLEFADFIPLVAPDGGRVVIDKFILCIQGTMTVATAVWDGRDVPRLMSNIVVEKRDGRLRWALSGYKSRLFSIKMNGIEEHQEHGNVAIAASQAVALRMIIPMRKRFTRRPNDFSLPADAFKKVTLTFGSLVNAATGTTVLSAPTGFTAYVLAEWHSENKVEFKTDDLIKSIDFNSNTQGRTTLSGVLHDLDICKESTTAGGDVVTAITDARIEDLGTPVLTFADLQHSYTVKRQIAPSGPTTPATERFLDPIREGKLLPVVTSDNATSPWDGRIVDSLKVDVGTGTTGLSMITREVVDKSQTDYQATVQRYGINPAQVAFASGDSASNGVDVRPLASVSQRKQKTGVWVGPLNKAG